MTELLLPPVYRAVPVAAGRSAFTEACRAAAVGAAEGALFWADRADRLDAALVLHPDRPRRDTLPVVYVAALAFADALAVFTPPPAPISFRWPGGIVIDGALAGTVSLRCPPDAAEAVPGWAVLGLDLALAAEGDEPGRMFDRTSIADEGFEDFSAAAHIEGFSRHFLLWLDRWERDGLAPIAAEWWRRTCWPPVATDLEFGGTRVTPVGLEPTGHLRVRTAGGEQVLSLAAALSGDDADG